MVVEPICRRFALTSTWWIISKTWKCQNQKRWNEYLWKFTTTQCWKEMIPNINQALVWLLSWVICDERLKPLWQMKGSWNVKENWSIKNLMKHIWNLPITDTPPKTLSCKISFKKKSLSPPPWSVSAKILPLFPFYTRPPPKKWGQRFLPRWNTAWCPLGGVCFHPVTSAKHNSIWSERWSKRASLGEQHKSHLTHRGKPPGTLCK